MVNLKVSTGRPESAGEEDAKLALQVCMRMEKRFQVQYLDD
jgi:hypothetical protein